MQSIYGPLTSFSISHTQRGKRNSTREMREIRLRHDQPWCLARFSSFAALRFLQYLQMLCHTHEIANYGRPSCYQSATLASSVGLETGGVTRTFQDTIPQSAAMTEVIVVQKAVTSPIPMNVAAVDICVLIRPINQLPFRQRS
jgi:hypothetical protein